MPHSRQVATPLAVFSTQTSKSHEGQEQKVALASSISACLVRAFSNMSLERKARQSSMGIESLQHRGGKRAVSVFKALWK
jgi:hypothetical protein